MESGFSIEMKNAKGEKVSLAEIGISKKHFLTGSAAVGEISEKILPVIFEENLDIAEITVIDNDFEEIYSHIYPEKERQYQTQYAAQKKLREMLDEISEKVDGNWNMNDILQDLIAAEKFVSEKIYTEGIFY